MSYDELLALPEEEFEARLDGGDYRELQAMCKYIGISAGGSAGDLKRRLLEHKAQSDAPVKSPEGRTGRARSPRRAVAAPQSRASAVSEAVEAAERVSAAAASASAPRSWPPPPVPAMPNTTAQVDPRTLSAAEFQAKFPGGAAAASSEMAVDTKDIQQSSFYGTPLGRTQRAQGVQSGFTPKLREEHQTLEAFLGGNEKSLPEAPPMPHVETTDPTMKVLLDGQAALLRGVNELRSTVVTRDALAHFYELQSQEMQTYVSAETAPLHNAVGRLGHDTQQLSRDAVQQFDRIGRLESRFDALKVAGPRKDDSSFRKLAFKGIPGNISAIERIRTIEEWMATHFKDIRVKVSNVHRGAYERNVLRPLTGVTLVEFNDSDIKRHVQQQIEADPARYKCTIGGKQISIKQAKSESASQRDGALNRAADVVKTDHRAAGKEIKKIHVGDRGVKVGDVYVFKQDLGNDLGRFVPPMSDLSLP